VKQESDCTTIVAFFDMFYRCYKCLHRAMPVLLHVLRLPVAVPFAVALAPTPARALALSLALALENYTLTVHALAPYLAFALVLALDVSLVFLNTTID
jgi:hypothetical protein